MPTKQSKPSVPEELMKFIDISQAYEGKYEIGDKVICFTKNGHENDPDYCTYQYGLGTVLEINGNARDFRLHSTSPCSGVRSGGNYTGEQHCWWINKQYFSRISEEAYKAILHYQETGEIVLPPEGTPVIKQAKERLRGAVAEEKATDVTASMMTRLFTAMKVAEEVTEEIIRDSTS